MSIDTRSMGAAGEFLVCADLTLSGHRAWQAPESFSFDVIADVEGRLVRVSVLSTSRPTSRPGRINSKEAYRWQLSRTSLRSTGKSVAKNYSSAITDMIALVALDTRQIAYISADQSRTSFEIEAPHGLNGTARFGPRDAKLRSFADFPMESALARISRGVA